MIMTRREWVLGSLAGVSALAGDVWKRNSSEWSAKDVETILTKSPWARTVKVEFKVGDLASPQKVGNITGPPPSGVTNQGGGGTRNETGGNPIGGAPVGRGGIPAEAGDLPKFQAVVRWESAVPLQRARKVEASSPAANRYVISVTGFPMMPVKAEAGDNGDDIKRYTRLERAGKAPMFPANVGARKGVLEFTFDGAADPITDADREVVLIVSTGSLEARARFYPREMMFEGKLAL